MPTSPVAGVIKIEEEQFMMRYYDEKPNVLSQAFMIHPSRTSHSNWSSPLAAIYYRLVPENEGKKEVRK